MNVSEAMARQKLTTRMTGIPRYRYGASPPVIEMSHSSPSHDASPSRSSSSDDSSSSSPSRSYSERGTSSKRARLSPTPSHKGKGKAIPRTHEGILGYVHRPLSPPPSHPMTMMDVVAALEDVLAQIHMLTSSVNVIKRNIEDRINKAARK
ncbi:hypothetical protein ACLB2K_063795 [Fragaria x ananassa]